MAQVEILNILSAMTLPKEDDFIEVSKDAPNAFTPGKRGVVVSVAKCRSKATEEATGIPIGSFVIWVGVLDGGSVDAKVIPAKWLRVVDQIE